MSRPVRLALGCAPAGFVPLVPDEGEYARAAAVTERAGGGSRLPAEALLHLHAYELVERILDGRRRGALRFSALLWPPCLFDALGIAAHAWSELETLLPRPLVQSWLAPAAREVEAECARLGLPAPPASDYVEALRAVARADGWVRRFLPPPGFDGAPEQRTAAGFLQRDGRILLELRPSDARVTPGVWDVPGGHVAAHEAAEPALVREFREELGVEVRKARFLRELDALEPPHGRRYRHSLFVVESFDGEPHAREGQRLDWFTPEEALRLANLNEQTGFALQELEEEERP